MIDWLIDVDYIRIPTAPLQPTGPDAKHPRPALQKKRSRIDMSVSFQPGSSSETKNLRDNGVTSLGVCITYACCKNGQ